MRMTQSRRTRVLLALAVLFVPAVLMGMEAPDFATSSSGGQLRTISGAQLPLPSEVVLKPFRAYDASLGEFREVGEKVLFQGQVRVPIRVYLAAVVLGEIDRARELDLDDAGKSVWTSDRALSGGPGQSAGWHELTWDGRAAGGLCVASGKYTAVFVAGDQAERERKVVHLNVLESDGGLGGGAYSIAGRAGGSPGGNSGKGGGAPGAGGSGGSLAASGA